MSSALRAIKKGLHFGAPQFIDRGSLVATAAQDPEIFRLVRATHGHRLNMIHLQRVNGSAVLASAFCLSPDQPACADANATFNVRRGCRRRSDFGTGIFFLKTKNATEVFKIYRNLAVASRTLSQRTLNVRDVSARFFSFSSNLSREVETRDSPLVLVSAHRYFCHQRR